MRNGNELDLTIALADSSSAHKRLALLTEGRFTALREDRTRFRALIVLDRSEWSLRMGIAEWHKRPIERWWSETSWMGALKSTMRPIIHSDQSTPPPIRDSQCTTSP